MSRFTYKTDNNVLEVWDNENPNEANAPFFRQEQWPDGTAWSNKAEIEAWANAFIASLENPNSEMVAGDSPSEPIKPRPKKIVLDPNTGLPMLDPDTNLPIFED